MVRFGCLEEGGGWISLRISDKADVGGGFQRFGEEEGWWRATICGGL